MKIYPEDKPLEVLKELDLGIVPAGEKANYRYIVENDNPDADLLRLVFEIDNDEVTIIHKPDELLKTHKALLEIEWAPSVTVKQGLKCDVIMKAKEVYG